MSMLTLLMPMVAQKPANFFSTKLANGLEVLVVEDKSVPLATVEITTKNGSYTESPEFNGLSHLYEHMFFKANKNYPSQETFMAKVRELGIVFNGTTSEERVNYFFTLPKNNWVAGLNFMNSAIRYPLFLAEEMKKENVVVDGEFQRNESNPYFPLYMEMNHALWGDLFSRKNVIGDHTIINTATPAKMQAIKDKYYWPNNSMSRMPIASESCRAVRIEVNNIDTRNTGQTVYINMIVGNSTSGSIHKIGCESIFTGFIPDFIHH